MDCDQIVNEETNQAKSSKMGTRRIKKETRNWGGSSNFTWKDEGGKIKQPENPKGCLSEGKGKKKVVVKAVKKRARQEKKGNAPSEKKRCISEQVNQLGKNKETKGRSYVKM